MLPDPIPNMAPPLILLYHHISRPSPLSRIRGLYTTPNAFRWQIRWMIGHGWSFTTFQQPGPEALYDLPEKTCILTFDDGTVSVMEQALPVLQSFGIPAVLFPITSFLGVRDVSIPTSTEQVPASFLSVKQIRSLSDAGWEIGSHLHSHRPVDSMREEEITNELKVSKQILEQITGKPVITVAYPYGICTERTIELAIEEGYKLGLTTDLFSSATHTLFSLSRVAVKGNRLHHRGYFIRNIQKWQKSNLPG